MSESPSGLCLQHSSIPARATANSIISIAVVGGEIREQLNASQALKLTCSTGQATWLKANSSGIRNAAMAEELKAR